MRTVLVKGVLMSQMKPLAAVVAAAGLALASLGIAMAAPAGKEPNHGYFGTLSAKSDGSFTIESKQGEPLAFDVTADTAFRTAGDQQVTLESIDAGRRVAILAEGEGDSRTALKVMVIPEHPPVQHRVVAVTEVSGKTALGHDLKGRPVEVDLDGGADADLAGHVVTFVATDDGKEARAEEKTKFKARARVKLEQVVDRLEQHAAKLRAEMKTETRPEVQKAKAESIAHIKARLEAHIESHQLLFAELIARAPESAKPKLEHALSVSVAGMSTALVALGQSKADVEARVNLHTAVGQVTAVDTATSTLKVKVKDGSDLELKVDTSTEVMIDGKAAVIADVEAGDRVMVRYNPQTKVAVRIQVQAEPNADAKTGAKAEGTVSSVDVVAGTLTVKTEDGALVTLNVDADTEFDVDGLIGGLAGLAAGTGVEVEYNAETMVATEVETREAEGAKIRPRIEAVAVGTVASDVASGGQLVLNLEGGGTLMLAITSDTDIEFSGQARGAADLHAGDRVRVKYDAETRVAEAIDIRGRSGASADTGGQEASGGATGVEASASGSASSNAGGAEARGEGNVNVKITLP